MSSTKLEQLRSEFIANFPRITKNTTPGDATFLRIAIESSRAKRGLEIGTATGYGAILMGLALERNGGKLHCVEVDAAMVAIARENIRKVRLQKTVKIVEGDALTIVPRLKGTFDFVFIDAVKPDYLKYLRAVEPKLEPGAMIVADNVIKFAKEMRDYLDVVLDNSAGYHTVIIRASKEKGDGMAVTYKAG
jgi:predicted O-methyltransferase YrrM